MGWVFSLFRASRIYTATELHWSPSFSRNVLCWWDTSRALVGQPLSSALILNPSLVVVEMLCHSGGVAELIASKKVSGDEKDCTIEFNP